MEYSNQQLWQRFQTWFSEFPELGMSVDLSRTTLTDEYVDSRQPRLQKAFTDMAQLESGAIANPDEKRMVGHYWLRNPALAPAPSIRSDIVRTLTEIKQFAADVHSGNILGTNGIYKNLLLIGIGGSALGPQFVAHALGQPQTDKMRVFFLDNTDPDGIDRVLATIQSELGLTLCLVISKSGGTKETRNGMIEAKTAYEKAKLKFEDHAVAITGTDSELDRLASQNRWIRRFPMWDWVGGRTSVTSAVGILPAALQGLDIDEMLAGAKACDIVTRINTFQRNPAAQLALAWYCFANESSSKDMVILPYKDRLELFARYLQQLIMESLGKELDKDNKVVNSGIAVYGNKGSTDQHAYVQQLRDGRNNFFVTFIEVLQDRRLPSIRVETDITSGDYLQGFLLGTRKALFDKGRESITITIKDVSAFRIGVLIALYERAVGLYASMVNINAYHQPGVEAGKKAAGSIIELKLKIIKHLRENTNRPLNATQIAAGIGTDDCEAVYKICEHLAENPDWSISRIRNATAPWSSTYQMVS